MNYSPPSVFVPFPTCRACGNTGPAHMQSKATTGAWLLAIFVGISICGLIFCWIPILLMRERFAVCGHCKVRF